MKTTLGSVQALLSNSEINSAQIVLFDDASTDGTREAVRAIAPEAHILTGDGKHFWNGGLHQAWHYSLGLKADTFTWLNDDVNLAPGTLARVDACIQEAWARRPDGLFILIGAVADPNGSLSYGGLRRRRSPWALRLERVPPGNDLTPVDTFNGNFVVVPRAVVAVIGLNDPSFHHNLGDVDYGLRAKAAGIDVWLMPGVVGTCPYNAAKAASAFGGRDLTLREQWRVVNTHQGLPFRNWLTITRRHSGLFFPLHLLIPYRRLVLPKWVLNGLDRLRPPRGPVRAGSAES